MKLTTISSGSSGNCYVLDNGYDLLLLDAGVSINDIFQHVENFGKICGCLLTHEHKDHSFAVSELSRLGISVYSSAGTFSSIGKLSAQNKAIIVSNKQLFDVGSYQIMAFDVEHDAKEPLGFLIKDKVSQENLLFVTDTWYLKYTFPKVNYWLIECNFVKEIAQEQFHENERHPLWKRIRTSHMSLEMLKETLLANDLSETYKLLLIHLSDSRSDEKRMINEVYSLTGIETIALQSGSITDLNKTAF